MDYGIAVTDAGRYLIARLLTGEELHITRVMVGSGRVPDGVRLSSVEALYEPVAQATSDVPRCDRGVAHMIVEYNSSMNGGLDASFWLREFGIFALDPENGEILLVYATLGDYPQFICAYDPAKGVDVRRFPISIAIGEDRGMVVDYHAGLWMTAEDVQAFFEETLRPELNADLSGLIGAHDRDPAAHGGFGAMLNTAVAPRIALAELMEEAALVTGGHVGYANAHITTFETLDGVAMTLGNYNDALMRVEY